MESFNPTAELLIEGQPPQPGSGGDVSRLARWIALSLAFHGLVFALAGGWREKPKGHAADAIRVVSVGVAAPPPLGLPTGDPNVRRWSPDKAMAAPSDSRQRKRRDEKRAIRPRLENDSPPPMEVPAEAIAAEGEGADGPIGIPLGSPKGSVGGLPGGIGTDPDGTVVDAVALDSLPQPVEQIEPEYPLAARKAGLQAKVVLKALLEPDGRVGAVRLVKSAGALGFDESALEAVGQWVFTPPTVNGAPVRAWMIIPINFRLFD